MAIVPKYMTFTTYFRSYCRKEGIDASAVQFMHLFSEESIIYSYIIQVGLLQHITEQSYPLFSFDHCWLDVFPSTIKSTPDYLQYLYKLYITFCKEEKEPLFC
jgi:hypothetical protein